MEKPLPGGRSHNRNAPGVLGRKVVTALGILLLSFGLLVWQWSAFSERNRTIIAGNQEAELAEEKPPADTHWHEAPSNVRMAVAGCIRGQLRALGSGQFEAGLQFHSRAVQGQMPSTDEYAQLIQTRYPVFAQHRRETFRFVNTDKKGRFANAGVAVTGADGTVMEAVYQLVFQNKQWLISGIARRPPLSLPTSQKP